MSSTLILILAISIPFILIYIGIYNRLVGLRNKMRNGLHQIDIQLQRRADLIPNLVETVKGYAKHERETLEAVIKARNQLIKAGSIDEKAQANNILTEALKQIFALAESYPDLKANENFLRLQEEITSTENQVSFARQFYNDITMNYNTALEIFPQNIVGALSQFKNADFFKVQDESVQKTPKVRF